MSIDRTIPPLLVVGYANVDLLARLPEPSRPGRRQTVPRIEVTPGGMAANTACVAACLGSPVSLFAAVGNDSFGRFLLDAWGRCGVDVRHVITSDARATTKCLISVEPDGERTIISERMTFDYGALNAALRDPALPRGAVVHFDGYRLEDFAPAADLARARGLTVAADLDGVDDARTLEEALPRLDIVFTNRATLARLFGDQPPARTLEEIAGRGPVVVIATWGKEGAWIRWKAETRHIPGHPVQVVDTTGAGDTFDGAFLSAYSRSRDPAWSARYANAAAAISVTGPGALGHVPTDEEIRRLIRQEA